MVEVAEMAEVAAGQARAGGVAEVAPDQARVGMDAFS